MNYDVKSLSLAEKGKLRIEWAGQDMPVLSLIEKRFRNWKAVAPKIQTGYLARYSKLVSSADKGAILT